MHRGDIQTVRLYRTTTGSFEKVFERDWLRYLGFTEKELEASSIQLVFKAEKSEKHSQPFIGFGKRFEK